MQKNTRLSEIDNEVEELCHQMNDAWSKNDIETHIKLFKQMKTLSEEGKRIRKECGEEDENIMDWIELK